MGTKAPRGGFGSDSLIAQPKRAIMYRVQSVTETSVLKKVDVILSVDQNRRYRDCALDAADGSDVSDRVS